MKPNLRLILRLAAGITILSFLIYKLDIILLYNTILSVNISILLLILIYYSLIIFISTLNLRLLLIPLHINIGVWQLFKYYLLAWSVGRFLLGRMGEFSIVYFFKRRGISYGDSMVVVILDKLITLIALVIFSSLCFFMIFSKLIALKLILIFVSLFILSCVALFSSKSRILVKKYILRKHSYKFNGFSRNLLYFVKRGKKFLLMNLILTFARILLGAFVILIIFSYFNISLPFWIVAAVNSAGVLISMIPISISGLGIKEASVVYLYSQSSISPVVAGSIYFLIRILGFILAGVVLMGVNAKLLKWCE